MDIRLRAVAEGDWEPITEIFNLFVADSFAAYPDQPVDESFFRDRRNINPTYPFVVAERRDLVVGFAYLSPFHSVSTMRRTAILTYFLHPEHTGQGIGTTVLEHLLQAGKNIGLNNFLAHVSSLNPGTAGRSIWFGCRNFSNVAVRNRSQSRTARRVPMTRIAWQPVQRTAELSSES
jgi:L-amino acid N-acyltransferase YncA